MFQDGSVDVPITVLPMKYLSSLVFTNPVKKKAHQHFIDSEVFIRITDKLDTLSYLLQGVDTLWWKYLGS